MASEAPENPNPQPKKGPQKVVTRDGVEFVLEKDQPIGPVTYDKTGNPVSPTTVIGEAVDLESKDPYAQESEDKKKQGTP